MDTAVFEGAGTVTDNILYQDNQSATLLEKNGTRSSGKRTRHLDIRYFFITDRVDKKKVRVAYCRYRGVCSGNTEIGFSTSLRPSQSWNRRSVLELNWLEKRIQSRDRIMQSRDRTQSRRF
jgi:hypothetical protein